MSDQQIILYKDQIENDLKYLNIGIKEKNKFSILYFYNSLIENIEEFINIDPSSVGGVLFQSELLIKFDQRKNILRDIIKKDFNLCLSYSTNFKMIYSF